MAMITQRSLGSIGTKMDKIDSITIGRFDGMHLGHKKLFERLNNGAVVVIENHKATLTPGKRRECFSDLPLVYYEFENIQRWSAKKFIQELKSRFANLKLIVVGNDFYFGFNKEASSADLKRYFDGEVEIIDEFCIDDIGVHTSKIKEFFKNGNTTMANKFLGRSYTLVGEIVKGNGLGKKEFVPTLNLDTKGYFLPKEGVYATKTLIDNISYKSVSFIGKRVSVDDEFSVESHILEPFSCTKVSKVELSFIDFMRDNHKFETFSDLKEQIYKDIEMAKRILEVER